MSGYPSPQADSDWRRMKSKRWVCPSSSRALLHKRSFASRSWGARYTWTCIDRKASLYLVCSWCSISCINMGQSNLFISVTLAQCSPKSELRSHQPWEMESFLLSFIYCFEFFQSFFAWLRGDDVTTFLLKRMEDCKRGLSERRLYISLVSSSVSGAHWCTVQPLCFELEFAPCVFLPCLFLVSTVRQLYFFRKLSRLLSVLLLFTFSLAMPLSYSCS